MAFHFEINHKDADSVVSILETTTNEDKKK
jgi:hypothetical protein